VISDALRCTILKLPSPQACGLKDRPCRQRRLFAASRTLPGLLVSAVRQRIPVFRADRADKAVQPSRPLQDRLALRLLAKLGENNLATTASVELDFVDRQLISPRCFTTGSVRPSRAERVSLPLKMRDKASHYSFYENDSKAKWRDGER
jgi:hypothetical protein